MSRHHRSHYEADDTTFDADAYNVSGFSGVACHILGWETEPDEETEWSGYENRTGRIVVVMVGDDQRHVVDEADITALDRSAYCGGCGQIGCTCDAYDRSEDDDDTITT